MGSIDSVRKQFFSEEKNQKTFALDAIPKQIAHDLNRHAGVRAKVFWFFSSEKNCFLKLP
jgi:hypothetical protein